MSSFPAAGDKAAAAMSSRLTTFFHSLSLLLLQMVHCLLSLITRLNKPSPSQATTSPRLHSAARTPSHQPSESVSHQNTNPSYSAMSPSRQAFSEAQNVMCLVGPIVPSALPALPKLWEDAVSSGHLGVSASAVDQTASASKRKTTTPMNIVSTVMAVSQNADASPALPSVKGSSPSRPTKTKPSPENRTVASGDRSTISATRDDEADIRKAALQAQNIPHFKVRSLGDYLTGEDAVHSRFMHEALDMARLALRTNETPVGCVLVHNGRVIAKGMNATNVTRNGTRHAELMAISALLSYLPRAEYEPECRAHYTEAEWEQVDPKNGHVYPYGQKLHPSPRLHQSVISECFLYVTVEPCVMCASLLRQLQIKKVFFGAVNDKFGGTGGVFSIHLNSSPIGRSPIISSTSDDAYPPRPILVGDGGNVEEGYGVEGGWGRDDAVTLLRQFYVQENNRAPVPRRKEGRAARLGALMGRENQPSDSGDSLLLTNTTEAEPADALSESQLEMLIESPHTTQPEKLDDSLSELADEEDLDTQKFCEGIGVSYNALEAVST